MAKKSSPPPSKARTRAAAKAPAGRKPPEKPAPRARIATPPRPVRAARPAGGDVPFDHPALGAALSDAMGASEFGQASGRHVAEAGGTPSRGKYVYCIIASADPLKFGAIGIGSEPAEVHTVHYKNIAAVVSDTRIEAHEPTRENVLAHERVNETVMRKHTVIPMSFGTVFKTREDIVQLLRSAYDAFHDVLHKMEDKLEFGVKVLWDRDVVIREIEEEEEDIRRLKEEIASQKGSTYFARMQYGRMVDAALQTRSERYVADILEQLRAVSVASRSNKPIGDKMIMNGAFLVHRTRESEFDARVKAVGAKYDTLTFRFTGPWPPYNFVNIRLKLERAKEAG